MYTRMSEEERRIHQQPLKEVIQNDELLQKSLTQQGLNVNAAQLSEEQRTQYVLRMKKESADAFIDDRISRMATGSKELTARLKAINKNNYEFRQKYRDMKQPELERRLIRAHNDVSRTSSLSESQVGKRRKKAAQKTATAIEMRAVASRFQNQKKYRLANVMKFEYKKILFGEAVANTPEWREMQPEIRETQPERFMSKIRERNPYFSELNEFAIYYENVTEWRRDSVEEGGYTGFDLANKINEPLDKDMVDLMQKSQASVNVEQEMLPIYERQIMGLDLHQFDYSSIGEFSEKIRKDHIYSTLKALTGARKILDRLEASGGTYQSPNLLEFKTRLDTLCDILDDYETRRQMLSSPYYILLAKKDAAGLSLKKLQQMAEKPEVQRNQDLSDYIGRLLKLKQSTGFKMGSSADKCYQQKKKTTLKNEMENARKKAGGILKATGFASIEKAVQAASLSELDNRIYRMDLDRRTEEAAIVSARLRGEWHDVPMGVETRESNEWVQRYKSHWFGNLGSRYNQYLGQYQGTFTKLIENMPATTNLHAGDDTEIKRRAENNDRYFDDLYLRNIMREQNGSLDVAGDLFHVDKESLLSQKEQESMGQLQDLIRKTQELIDLELDRKQREYDAEMRRFKEQAGMEQK